jgi:sigma-B regulation protein RsbU (phosphoserine phosphatase)
LRIQETNRALAREHHRRLEELRDAQQAILTRPEDYPQARFDVFYKPLEEAGGDIYDVMPLDGDVFAYFAADISGHGLSSAFLTSAVKALLRQYSGPVYSPEDTLRGVNAVMQYLLGDEQYLTACYARLNRRTRRLSVVSAGHPPVIVVNGSGSRRILQMNSDPLGVFGSAVLQRTDLEVEPGDRFFLYTDGLIESKAGWGRNTGLQNLAGACVRHRSAEIGSVCALIVDDLRSQASDVEDDLLLLAVEALPV